MTQRQHPRVKGSHRPLVVRPAPLFLPMPMSFDAASLIGISDLPPALHVLVVERMGCCPRNVVVPVVFAVAVVAVAVVAA